jgi:hypothetical protein
MRFPLRSCLALGAVVLCFGCVPGLNRPHTPPVDPGGPGDTPLPADWVEQVKFPDGLSRPDPGRETDIVSAVDDLGSEDFGHRTRGSRALVAYGEASVPYLGNRITAVTDKPDPGCAHCLLVYRIVRKLPEQRIAEHLRSPYSIVRIAASESAADRNLESLTPNLALMLDDPVLEVRSSAVTALRRITKDFLGYRPADSARKREDAAAAWRRKTGAEKES